MDVYVVCDENGQPVSVHARQQGAAAELAGRVGWTILNFDLRDEED